MTTLIEINMIVDVRISTQVQTCIPKSVVPWTASLLVWSEKTTHKKITKHKQTKHTHAQTELQPQTKLTHEQRSQNQVWWSTLHRSWNLALIRCLTMLCTGTASGSCSQPILCRDIFQLVQFSNCTRCTDHIVLVCVSTIRALARLLAGGSHHAYGTIPPSRLPLWFHVKLF